MAQVWFAIHCWRALYEAYRPCKIFRITKIFFYSLFYSGIIIISSNLIFKCLKLKFIPQFHIILKINFIPFLCFWKTPEAQFLIPINNLFSIVENKVTYYCEKIWISYRRIFVSQSTTPQGKKSI